MSSTFYMLHGIRVLACTPEGKKLKDARDATELIAEAWQHQAALVVIPIERLEDDFFQLATGVAGEIIQKFVTYNLRVTMIGDVTSHTGSSAAFRAWVQESNRGDRIWFVRDTSELEKRMALGVAGMSV